MSVVPVRYCPPESSRYISESDKAALPSLLGEQWMMAELGPLAEMVSKEGLTNLGMVERKALILTAASYSEMALPLLRSCSIEEKNSVSAMPSQRQLSLQFYNCAFVLYFIRLVTIDTSFLFQNIDHILLLTGGQTPVTLVASLTAQKELQSRTAVPSFRRCSLASQLIGLSVKRVLVFRSTRRKDLNIGVKTQSCALRLRTQQTWSSLLIKNWSSPSLSIALQIWASLCSTGMPSSKTKTSVSVGLGRGVPSSLRTSSSRESHSLSQYFSRMMSSRFWSTYLEQQPMGKSSFVIQVLLVNLSTMTTLKSGTERPAYRGSVQSTASFQLAQRVIFELLKWEKASILSSAGLRYSEKCSSVLNSRQLLRPCLLRCCLRVVNLPIIIKVRVEGQTNSR